MIKVLREKKKECPEKYYSYEELIKNKYIGVLLGNIKCISININGVFRLIGVFPTGYIDLSLFSLEEVYCDDDCDDIFVFETKNELLDWLKD